MTPHFAARIPLRVRSFGTKPLLPLCYVPVNLAEARKAMHREGKVFSANPHCAPVPALQAKRLSIVTAGAGAPGVKAVDHQAVLSCEGTLTPDKTHRFHQESAVVFNTGDTVYLLTGDDARAAMSVQDLSRIAVDPVPALKEIEQEAKQQRERWGRPRKSACKLEPQTAEAILRNRPLYKKCWDALQSSRIVARLSNFLTPSPPVPREYRERIDPTLDRRDDYFKKHGRY